MRLLPFRRRPRTGYYIEIFYTTGKKYRWRIKHENGQTVQSSSDDYASLSGMMRTVRRFADKHKFEVRDEASGERIR